MEPTTSDRLSQIEARANAATTGPWYAINDDDDWAMNVNFVSTVEGQWFDEHKRESYENIVAITLFQNPRIVCHKSDKWDEDMYFIAAARSDVPWLVERVRQLESALEAASECIGPPSDHYPSSDDGWHAVAVQVAAALRGDDQ